MIVPVQAPANFADVGERDADAGLEGVEVFAVASVSAVFAFGFAGVFFGLACTSGAAVGVAGTGVAEANVEGAGGAVGAGVGLS